MSSLLSNWSRNLQFVPPHYVLPEDKRPGDEIAAPICKDIPVIDLSQLAGLDRNQMIQQIMKAAMNLGIFQVINHGVSKELMDETMNLFKEFINMPAENRATYCPEDGVKGFGLYTSSTKGNNFWKDTLRHICEPNIEDNIHSWPEKPTRYREVVKAYSMEVKKLGSNILDLICEGLGIKLGYFEGELTQHQDLLVNNYPPCPEPSLVLGGDVHTDLGLLTILQQEDIYGLQIFKDSKWFGVEPIPHAFVINVADQLEVITNGKLKSAPHRAVTNNDVARMSIATFFVPSLESIIEPKQALLKPYEPKLFKSFQFKEYRDSYFANHRQKDPTAATTLDAYKL